MDFKQLQSYVSAVKYKSFTAAAEELKISQPTISIHIKNLEDELNSRLIIRTAKAFEVTPRGQAFFDYAQNVLIQRENLLSNWNGQGTRVIHLGVSTIPSAYILPHVLPTFSNRYEDIYFEVNQNDSRNIIDAVHKGQYDIGIVGMKVEDELLEFKKFYQDKMVLITPVTDRYLAMKSKTEFLLEDILREPLILREEGSGSGKTASKFLKEMGLKEEDLHIAARINDQEAIKNLVAEGLGVSIVSELAMRDYVSSHRVLQFDLPDAIAGREFYIIYQKNYILKEHIVDFIRYLSGAI